MGGGWGGGKKPSWPLLDNHAPDLDSLSMEQSYYKHEM